MKILAIDTATEACSAALLMGETVLGRYQEPKRGHSELILPMVDELLREAGVTLKDLDAIAVGRGPGAFTGVRIAISVVQGLAFGADKPVVAVSDLAAMAQRAADEQGIDTVVACIDARMNEVYWGGFRKQANGLMAPIIEEQIGAPESVAAGVIAALGDGAWIGAGTGWSAYPALAAGFAGQGRDPGTVSGSLFPRAQEIARLAVHELAAGRAVPAEQVEPVYLRNRVASPSSNRNILSL